MRQTASQRPFFEMTDICKAYWMGDEWQPVLRDVRLSIREGEFLSVLGPSGSGKSTLMNIIGCLDTPSGSTSSMAAGFGTWSPTAGRHPQQGDRLRVQSFQLLPGRTPWVTWAALDLRGDAPAQAPPAGGGNAEPGGPSDKLYHLLTSSPVQQQRWPSPGPWPPPYICWRTNPQEPGPGHGQAGDGSVWAQHKGHTIIMITHDGTSPRTPGGDDPGRKAQRGGWRMLKEACACPSPIFWATRCAPS